MTPSGTGLAAGTPTALLTPTQSWQGGVVEGPDMLVSGGQYQLFYAGNNWQTSAYAIGVATCSGPLGPCTDDSNQPLVASDSTMSGPGGPSVFTDTQGNLWIAFAAWLPGEVGSPNSRPLFLRRVTESGGVPTVANEHPSADPGSPGHRLCHRPRPTGPSLLVKGFNGKGDGCQSPMLWPTKSPAQRWSKQPQY